MRLGREDIGERGGRATVPAMKTEKKSTLCNTYIITVLKRWASIIITCVIITVVIITIIRIMIIIIRNNFILFWLTKLFRAFVLFVITSVYSICKFSPSVRRSPGSSVG